MKAFGFLMGLIVILCGGCSSQQAVEEFNHTVESKTQYQRFTAEEYQNDQVPLNEFVELAGTIIQTDNPDQSSIKKEDRFVLQAEKQKYQIINQSSETDLHVADKVVIYGEYYGFIQAHKIEK